MSNKEKTTTEGTESTESAQAPAKEVSTTKNSATQKGKKQGAQAPAKETPATKAPTAQKEKKPAANNALKSVGLAACKRHKLDHVWVTTDGQTFPNESDAKNHARNLSNNELIKVTTK